MISSQIAGSGKVAYIVSTNLNRKENSMATEENKALVRRLIEEAWNKGNLAVIDELLSPDYVLHFAAPGATPDREGYKQAVSMHHTAFADFRLTIEDMVAEGDKVVIRWTIRGTHKGEYIGIAATGKEVTMTGISIRRIEGGKIMEEWLESDMLGLMQQMGVVPSPGQ
ncbi:MAG: ester cyclase [Anaerolineae bacterium]